MAVHRSLARRASSTRSLLWWLFALFAISASAGAQTGAAPAGGTAAPAGGIGPAAGAPAGAGAPAAQGDAAAAGATGSTSPQAAHAASGAAGQPTALPPRVSFVTSVEGVNEYRIETNGMRILLVPDPAQPSITVNVTYRVGSRQENYGETGMAHLLEHMMFKGTPKHPQLSEEFKQRGIRWNATTSLDRTNYFETFPATGDNLDWVLRMEADRMVNSFIARKDLDSEMTVVRNEMESGENNPVRILYQRMTAMAYDWHNYGHSTIGARADVENVSIPRLQAFYHEYYQPDNATIIVGGRFDPAKTLALIADAFGALPKPKRVIEPTYTIESAQDGERQVLLRRVGDIQHVAVLYHTVAVAHPDYAALSALTDILGDTPSGRLHKALVETRKATNVSAWLRDTREPGDVVFFATVGRDDSLEEAKKILIDVVEGSGSQPVTAEELKRVQTATQKDFDQTIASPDALVSSLSEAVAWGDWRLFFKLRDEVLALKPGDVQAVAAKYMKPSNRTLGEFIPTDKPDRAPAPVMVDAGAAVKDYKGRAAVAAGEAFDPTPENIDARTTRIQLGNGLKLLLLPKKTRGEIVNARLQLHFGDERSLVGKREIGRLTGAMLMRGTKTKTREQIRDAFDALKTDASVSGGAEGGGASLVSTRENLPAALRLVAEVLREPSFPESEFEQLKKQAITGVEASRREPGPLAGQAVRRHFNHYPADDVRYAPSFDEQIAGLQAVTRDQVVAFHDAYYGAQEGELAVVGDFDPEEVKVLATELFGSWKAKQSFTRVPVPFHTVPAQVFQLETPDKANAVLMGGAALPIRDDDPDAMALTLANFLLGGSETSRIWVRVREKEGVSYDVGSSLALSAFEPNSSWNVSAIFAPQNLGRLRTAISEEIERARRDGFTEAEVEDGRKGLLERRRLSRADDGAVAGALAALAFRGRTAAFLGDNDRKIAALTREQVNAALVKYLKPDMLTTAVAGDFAKK